MSKRLSLLSELLMIVSLSEASLGCSPNFIASLRIDTTKSNVTSTTPTVSADGISQGTLMVNLKSSDGSSLAGAQISVVSNRGSAVDTVISMTSVSDATGFMSFRVTSTVSGQATFTANSAVTGIPLSSKAQINFVAGPLSLTQSSLTLGANTILGNHYSTVTLAAKDQYGNSITTGGQNVTFSASSGVGISTGTFSNTIDSGNGTYLSYFYGVTSGTATTISANVTGLGTLTQTGSVAVNVILSNYMGGSMNGYSLNLTTGIPSVVTGSGQSANGVPNLTPSGKWGYSYVGSTIYQYSVNPSNGLKTALSVPSITSSGSISALAVHQNEKWFYVSSPNVGITQYSIDSNTGQLSNASFYPISTTPYQVAIHPSGKSMYLVNNPDNTITQFSIDPVTGAILPLSTNSIAIATSPQRIAFSIDGKWAYATANGTGNIFHYSVDPTTGALGSVTSYFLGSGPREIVVHPTGKWIYVSQNGGSTIAQYSIDPSSGVLVPLSPATEGAGSSNPMNLAIEPSGAYLYAAVYADSSITSYPIDSATGRLFGYSKTYPGTGSFLSF